MIRARILVGFGHPAWQEAITSILSAHFEVIGVVDSSERLVAESLRLRPDVIVTEVHTTSLNGMEVIRKLTALGSKARVVFVTIHEEQEYMMACRAAGAAGYILKSEVNEQLIPTITAAVKGETDFRT